MLSCRRCLRRHETPLDSPGAEQASLEPCLARAWDAQRTLQLVRLQGDTDAVWEGKWQRLMELRSVGIVVVEKSNWSLPSPVCREETAAFAWSRLVEGAERDVSGRMRAFW